MCSNDLLTFFPDTREHALKLNNLEKPEKLAQAVTILEQWIKKQDHFLQKDYDRRYLENAVFTAKGSIEKAKEKIEKMCILKTLIPKFWDFKDIKADFKNILATHCPGVPMAKLTPEHYRVVTYKLLNDEYFNKISYMEYYKFFLIMYEYLKLHDMCAGYLFVIDMRNVNIMEVISKLNILEFKNIATLLLEAQGLQLKGLIYLTPSKAIDSLIRIIKPVLSEKVAHRIHVCKDPDSLKELVPEDILPVEFGGTNRSYKDILEDWVHLLSENENLNYILKMKTFGVTEDYKKIIKDNDKYSEMNGSFVALEFD